MRLGGGGGQGVATFLITSQFNHIDCVGGNVRFYFSNLQSFQLVMQDSHPSLYYTKAWYHLYISDPFW